MNTIKKNTFALCLLYAIATFCTTAVWAQNDYRLPGVVVEQNSQYRTKNRQYLSDVYIQSIPSCIPTRSDT